jgi:hypothetical protein
LKAIISAKILKNVLKTVKSITDTLNRDEILFGFNVSEKGLCLQSAGGLYVSCFLTTDFEDVEEFIPVDISTLASLKFPSDKVEISTKGSNLMLRSEDLEVELALPHLEKASIKAKDIATPHQFKVQDLLRALDFHTYGTHHNPLEASKRLVCISGAAGRDRLNFQSYDKQVSAFNHMPFDAVDKSVEIYVIPRPIITTLNNVTDEFISFGTTKQYWRIKTDTLDVIYPNMVKPQAADFEKILTDISSNPSMKIAFDSKHITKTLGVLSPSIKAGKEENPKMHFYIKDDSTTVQVTVASERIKGMKFELEGQLLPDRTEVEETAIALNFRYVREFVDNLSGDVVYFQYWKSLDYDAPLKGRVLSFFNDNGRYLIARLTL